MLCLCRRSSTPSSRVGANLKIRSPIQPFILGRGKSGQAVARCLALLQQMGEFQFDPIVWIERGQSLRGLPQGLENTAIFISNPHGLHAKAILDAEKAGFQWIFCDKPAAVLRGELAALRQVKAPVAVFHGYRQTWGPQTLKAMENAGELGAVFAVEGRYWQSSAADRALQGGKAALAWKNDPSLSGPHDSLLDLATHWADLALFLIGERPRRSRIWRSYINAEAAHRDTHLHLSLEFSKDRRALASISKTAHGASNALELHVLGARRSASWSLSRPDEITVGEGRDRRVVTRKGAETGGRLPPFHGLGWLDGYLEIIRRALGEKRPGAGGYPTLRESLGVLDALLP